MNLGVIEFNAIAYLAVLIYYIIKKKALDVGLLLLSIYVLSSSSAIMMYHHFMFAYSVHDNKPLQYFPFIYLFGLLMFCFYPILKYKYNDPDRKLECVDEVKFKYLVLFLFGISTIATVFFIPEAMKGMSGDIAINREDIMIDERKIEMNAIVSQMQNISKYLMNFSMVLFCYSLCFKQFRKYTLLLVVPAFIYPVIFSMVFSARGGLVFLLMSAVILFFLLKNYFPANIKRIFIVGTSILGGLLGIIFVIITLARFGDSTQGVEYFMYKYVGESFINFNGILWQDLRGLLDGDTCFPGIRKILGMEYRTSLYEFRIKGARITNIPIYIFYTFIGDLICDFGKIITAILVVIFGVGIRKVFKETPVLTLRRVMVMGLTLSILSEGVLFFSYQASNMTFVLTVLLYFYLKPKAQEEESPTPIEE